MFLPVQEDCPVHSECLLIQYLGIKDGSEWDNVPPFNYIGASKPSCSACFQWIEAFNKLGGRKFYTRGSQGKWSWPWGMAEVEGVREGLVKKVYKEYITHLQGRGLLTLECAQPSPSTDEMTFFRSFLHARVPKYRAHKRDEFEGLHLP